MRVTSLPESNRARVRTLPILTVILSLPVEVDSQHFLNLLFTWLICRCRTYLFHSFESCVPSFYFIPLPTSLLLLVFLGSVLLAKRRTLPGVSLAAISLVVALAIGSALGDSMSDLLAVVTPT